MSFKINIGAILLNDYFLRNDSFFLNTDLFMKTKAMSYVTSEKIVLN